MADRQPYLGPHVAAGTRTPYLGGTTAPAAKKSGGGGFLGALKSAGHFVAKKTELAARDVKGIPGGIVHEVNVGAVQPWKDVITTGHVSKKTNRNIDKLTKGTADSLVASVAHPLRDPFLTATTLLPVANSVARGAEVAAGADIGKARVLRSGSKEVPLIRSRSATGRTVQRGYDRVVQKALDKNDAGQATGRVTGRVAAHGQKRIGGALSEEGRVQAKMRAAPASMLDRAAVKLSKAPGKRRVEQAALELTSAQTSAEEAARYHLAQAAKGVNVARNEAVAKLYQRVHERGLVHVDESKPAGSRVFINPAETRLAKTDAALGRVQATGDKILVEKGVREPGALTSRRDAPGQVRAGAKHMAPRDVQNETRALNRTDRALEREATRIKQKVKRTVRAPKETLLEPTLAREQQSFEAGVAARDQRAKLFDAVDRAEKQVARHEDILTSKLVLHSEGKIGPLEVTRQVAKTTAARKQLDVAKTELRRAQREGGRLADEQRALHGVSEQARAKAEVLQGQALGKHNTSLGRVSRERARVAEQRAIIENARNRFLGGETARPGRGFVSYKASEKKLGKAEASTSPGPVVGAAKSPLTAKTFTGRSIEQGFVPKEVTGSASRHFRQILRFVNTDEARKTALETGSPTRRSPRDILVRVPDEKAKPLSAEIQQALGRESSTVDKPADLATQEGLEAAHQAFIDRLIPGRADGYAQEAGHAIGTPAPDGYRWVDHGALGDLLKPPRGPRGRVARTADTINSAITSATVYFKVGHVGTRVFTNAATNIIQGSAGPRQIGKSAKLWGKLSEEEKVRALAAAGQHGFAALPHEGTNLSARVATKGAQWWAKHVDAPFRFNSLAFELRKIGYTKPADVGRALDGLESGGQGLSGSEWAKLSAAARRADREAISYDRLNDFEKRFITRAVWFYPWIKGSTQFTVRTLIEHPYKAGVLGQAGAYGHHVQQQQLGDTPSYEAGLIPLTGGRNPLTTDFSTFSPFSTAADVAEAPIRPGALAGFLNPAAGVAGQLAYGLNQYGGTSNQPYIDAAKSLAASTPEQQIAEAYAGRNSDQSGKMFPKSPGGTGLRFLLGPATPRRVNVSALAKAAARERSGRR